MSQQIKNTGAHSMEAKATTPRRVHTSKLTLTRVSILRNTRAGEASRKSSFSTFALDNLHRNQDFYKQTFLIEASLVENKDVVFVGMTLGQFKVWADLVDGVRSRAGLEKSYIEKDLSTLAREDGHLEDKYWREPGLSMKHPEAVLVAMKPEGVKSWHNIRVLERGHDLTLLRREAEVQHRFLSREKQGRRVPVEGDSHDSL